MRGVLIFMYCLSVLIGTSSNVKFIHEPKDSCIPWRGQSQLICKVDHPKATYSWLAIRHAPLDLIFFNGRLHFLKESNVLFEKSEAIVENSSFVNVNTLNGRLLLKHPTSVDKINRSKSLMLHYKSWLEGFYRCKASVPGQGSLVSHAVNIRLSDLFLEPNLPTTHGLLSNSHQSLITEFQQYSTPPVMISETDTNKHPSLGGGSFYPGEVVVLRCPLIAISSVKPIIRWFHVTSDVMVMQPVGFDTDFSHSTWPNSYEAIPLDGGRWLEIHLGHLNTSPTSRRHEHNQSEWNGNFESLHNNNDPDKKSQPNEDYFRAGFGEYFCEVHIPSIQQVDNVINQPDKMGLNNTGPYIPVTLFSATTATSSSSPSTSTNVVSESKTSNSRSAVVWSVQAYELIQVEFPSIFLHSIEIISAISSSSNHDVKNQQLSLNNGNKFQERHNELWCKVNSSITLLCASNIRRFSNDNNIVLDRSGVLWFNSSRLTDGYGIQWKKDGEILSDKLFRMNPSYFRIVGSASLLINNAQLEDTGIYSCQVVNFMMNSILDETTIQLIIGNAPVLMNASSTELQAKLHFEQILWCNFKTYYPTIVQWRKNGEIIQDSEYFRVTNNFTPFSNQSDQFQHHHRYLRQKEQQIMTQIKIQRILPNDSGYFQCLAENRFGSVQHTIMLHVVQSNSNDYINDGVDYNNNMYMFIPTNVRVWNISDTHAYVMWDEPQWYLSKPFMYFIQIESDDTPGHLTVNTTKSVILLADLQPETKYTLKIFPALTKDSSQQQFNTNNFASVRFITKPLIHRPLAVKDISAVSWNYGTLTISWKTPLYNGAENDKIVSYQIILRSLTTTFNPNDDNTDDDPISHKLPTAINVHTSNLTITDNGDRLSYTVLNLTPDAFYQITIYPITETNITGHVAYLTSSPRVTSRPPSKPPMNLHVHSIGAHVATVSWEPPPVKYRNGQLIVYRINISCEDWLRPRHIMVQNKLSQLIQGLTSGMEYELTISAATRAGNGPDSEVLTFTTMTQKNEADFDAENNKSNDGYMLSSDALSEDFGAPIIEHRQPSSLSDNKLFSPVLGPVENLQFLAEEQSLLVMWSPPIYSYSSGLSRTPLSNGRYNNRILNTPLRGNKDHRTDISHYIVAWGKMHPGPDSVELPKNQTSYSIQKLEQDTTYFIKVVVVGKNHEMKEAFISARTKPSSSSEHLPIPLNLHVSSSDSNWAILTWDKTECAQQSHENNNNHHNNNAEYDENRRTSIRSQSNQLKTSSINDCLNNNNKHVIKFYQVAYQIIGYSSNLTRIKNFNNDDDDVDKTKKKKKENDDDSDVHLTNGNRRQDLLTPSPPSLDRTQHMISVTENWAKLENLQFGRLYSVVVRAVGEKKSLENSHFSPINNDNKNNNHDQGQELNNILYSEWSLEQIIETPEKRPGDSPRDISLIGLSVGVGGGAVGPSSPSSSSSSIGEQLQKSPVSIQISWQPPIHPNGPLTGYLLYYTTNHSLPLMKWSKRHLPPDSLNTVISGLVRNAIYAFCLKATNSFGDGPISSVKFYRTPDVYDQGGGVLTFADHDSMKSVNPINSLKHDIINNDKIVNYPADLIFVKQPTTLLDNGKQYHGSSSSGSGNSTVLYTPIKSSWLIFGIMIGFSIMILIIIVISLFYRKHRRNFDPLMNHKLGQNLTRLPDGDNLNETNNNNTTTLNNNNNWSRHINTQNNSISSQYFGKKRKGLTKSSFGGVGANAGTTAGNQDVALLMSNGEALLASDNMDCSGVVVDGLQQPSSNLLVSGVLVTMPNVLTTSMNLSSATVGVGASNGSGVVGAGQISSAGITPNQGVLYHNQNNMNTGSSSWDRDSDSLQFASVSQERTVDSSQSPNNITTSGHGQMTPTNGGSAGSTNSAHGSIGTPTRIIPNLAYHQVHGFPNDPTLGYSYPAVSIFPNIVNPMIIPSRPSVNNNNIPINGYPNHLIPSIIPSNSINNNGISSNHNNMNNYLVHYYPTTSMYDHHLNNRIPTDRFPSIVSPQPPPHMVYTGQSSSRYPVPCNIDQSQMVATYAHVINPSAYTTVGQPGFVNVNTPRVNAAEIMSFTSSEDIGPGVSTSVNENDLTQKFLPVNGDDHSRNKAYISSPVNHTHTTPKSKRSSSGTTGSRSITSPRRRPLPNSNRNERNADLYSNESVVADQQNLMSRSNNNSNNNTMTQVKQGSNRNSVIGNHNGVEGEHEGVQKAFSSEELTQEMANLEGLMKDLSAIAQEEFNC
uniref:Cell adhesion molecule n=1 Tax=Schistosoma mansoni TaxID=6183 RepID=A0A3Q0KID2_SCHMA